MIQNWETFGISLASESQNSVGIENIIIQNNVIIGTRIGIYFFLIGSGGLYNNIKILHNTLWKVSVSWFKEPTNKPSNCEMINYFIYYENQKTLVLEVLGQ